MAEISYCSISSDMVCIVNFTHDAYHNFSFRSKALIILTNLYMKFMGGGNVKRFIYYLSWSILVIFLLYVHNYIKSFLEGRFYETLNIRPYILFIWLYPIIIGVLIRLPKFLIDIKYKNLQWYMDWINLVAVGLPFFIISAVPLYEITTIISAGFALNFMGVTYIAGIIFGYTLVNSIK